MIVTDPKRCKVVVISIAIFILLLLAAAVMELRSARAAAETAADNARACRAIGQRIERLQQEPVRAGTEARASTELAKKVEEAAQFAQFTEQNVFRVTPQAPQRIEETPYKEQPTHVQLHGVTLVQLARMLHFLNKESKLDVASLRVTAPRQAKSPAGGTVERWDAEVTLTYLYFEPKTPPSR